MALEPDLQGSPKRHIVVGDRSHRDIPAEPTPRIDDVQRGSADVITAETLPHMRRDGCEQTAFLRPRLGEILPLLRCLRGRSTSTIQCRAKTPYSCTELRSICRPLQARINDHQRNGTPARAGLQFESFTNLLLAPIDDVEVSVSKEIA
jgi:hypothetical protein